MVNLTKLLVDSIIGITYVPIAWTVSFFMGCNLMFKIASVVGLCNVAVPTFLYNAKYISLPVRVGILFATLNTINTMFFISMLFTPAIITTFTFGLLYSTLFREIPSDEPTSSYYIRARYFKVTLSVDVMLEMIHDNTTTIMHNILLKLMGISNSSINYCDTGKEMLLTTNKIFGIKFDNSKFSIEGVTIPIEGTEISTSISNLKKVPSNVSYINMCDDKHYHLETECTSEAVSRHNFGDYRLSVINYPTSNGYIVETTDSPVRYARFDDKTKGVKLSGMNIDALVKWLNENSDTTEIFGKAERYAVCYDGTESKDDTPTIEELCDTDYFKNCDFNYPTKDGCNYKLTDKHDTTVVDMDYANNPIITSEIVDAIKGFTKDNRLTVSSVIRRMTPFMTA